MRRWPGKAEEMKNWSRFAWARIGKWQRLREAREGSQKVSDTKSDSLTARSARLENDLPRGSTWARRGCISLEQSVNAVLDLSLPSQIWKGAAGREISRPMTCTSQWSRSFVPIFSILVQDEHRWAKLGMCMEIIDQPWKRRNFRYLIFASMPRDRPAIAWPNCKFRSKIDLCHQFESEESVRACSSEAWQKSYSRRFSLWLFRLLPRNICISKKSLRPPDIAETSHINFNLAAPQLRTEPEKAEWPAIKNF
jgi:hypothetical protein